MPSTATTRVGLEKIAPGEKNNTWGADLGAAFDRIDEALDGMTSFALSGTKALTSTSYVANEARARYLNITSGTGGTVTIPNVEKVYHVRNNATGAVVFTTGSGTTASVPAGSFGVIMCEGSNIVRRATQNASIQFVMDGGGGVIATGVKGDIQVPFDCTVTGWDILADVSGSIVVDIWRDTYANFPPTVADTITGSEKPTLSSAIKNSDNSLTTFTTALAKDDILRFNVDSASTVTRVTVALKVVR